MTKHMKDRQHLVAHPRLLDKEWIHGKYHVQGFSIPRIAKELSCSECAVKKGLKRFGIAPRNRHHPRLIDGEYTPETIEPFKMKLHKKTWLAAVIDCEGWIGLFRKRTTSGFCYYAGIGVGNTRKELLTELQAITNIGTIRPTKRTNPNAKPVWTWSVRKQHDVKKLLKTITPYLLLKRQQADLILTLPPPQTKTPFLRATIKAQMAALNRRGV